MQLSPNSLVFYDALERTICNPTSSAEWEKLRASYLMLDPAEMTVDPLQQLAAAIGFSGIAGFFHANFLSAVSADLTHVEAAARIALEIRPVDAERLMAFATHEWGRGLVETQSRSDFLRRLAAARIPALMALAASTVEAAFAAAFTHRVVEAPRRIALVTPMISDAGHTPTDLTLSLAHELRATGVEAKLFAPQDLQLLRMAAYLGNGRSVFINPPNIAALAARLPVGVDARLSQASYSLPLRWRGLASDIATYDPDLILFVGLFAPWMAPLLAHRPVVAMSLHSSPPIVPADVILSADETLAGRRVQPWGDALPPSLVHFHPFRIAAKPLISGVSRAELGIAEEAILMIVVGARLKHEMSAAWSRQLAGLMLRRPEMTLMLVGGAAENPPGFAAVPSHQLRILGHREDIGDLLALSDIYINPPRMGGGFSVAEAMAAGLPVLCLADGDGGDKVGPLALAGMTEYWARLEAYLDNPQLRRHDGASLRGRFTERLDIARSGPSLLRACHSAIALFNARRGLPAAS